MLAHQFMLGNTRPVNKAHAQERRGGRTPHANKQDAKNEHLSSSESSSRMRDTDCSAAAVDAAMSPRPAPNSAREAFEGRPRALLAEALPGVFTTFSAAAIFNAISSFMQTVMDSYQVDILKYLYEVKRDGTRACARGPFK